MTLLTGAVVACPLTPRAQQPPAMPVIGFVNSGTAGANVKNVAAFRAGLTEAGFIEGQNVAIEFHWAENQFDRLPALVTGLINRPAAVIVGNSLAALRAKAATTTIPIVFTTGSDPVRDGLVTKQNFRWGHSTSTTRFALCCVPMPGAAGELNTELGPDNGPVQRSPRLRVCCQS